MFVLKMHLNTEKEGLCKLLLSRNTAELFWETLAPS